MDGRIPPLNDPNPIEPRAGVGEIVTTDLPEYATTADEWWLIVDRIWPAILDIFERTGLMRTQRFGDESGEINMPFPDYVEKLKTERDRRLARWLEHAWTEAPDASFIHTWPQWGRFCDLCSEQHVLFPEVVDHG